MPCVSQFFGIVIYLYHRDQSPPHFHAEYGEDEALYSIMTLEVIRGSLSRRVHNLVLEWADLHREELMSNWLLARQHRPLEQIEPLR
jgi:hypothetical protein